MKAINIILSILIFLLSAVAATFSYFLFEKRSQFVAGWGKMAAGIEKTAKALDKDSGTKVGSELSQSALAHENFANLSTLLPKLSAQAESVIVERNHLADALLRINADGSRRNSFPSGHTATAFMTATMLHKEYGWRSPWFSIGGYTAAAVTGVSRILNNRHWLSDVIAGGAIGIGSVHLGYFITDCIFKEKGLYDGYVDPEFYYNPAEKHYVAELVFGRRFILGGAGYKAAGTLPVRGSLAGLSADVPLAPGTGLTARASSSSLTFESSEVIPLYSTMAGGFYNFHFAKILELQVKAMAGYAWSSRGYLDSEMVDMATGKSGGDITDGVRVPSLGAGVALGAGVGLSLITDNNFKIKAFADLESMSLDNTQPWLSTLVLGFSTAWFW